MPAVRNILKHVSVKEARARRQCGRNKKEHTILKGQKFLYVKENGQGYSNYCLACAPEILTKAQYDLNDLVVGIQAASSN